MKKIIKIIILISIILLSLYVILNYFYKSKNKSYINTNTTTEIIEKNKNETGASAETEVYDVIEEYDGKEVLVIKPEIQFRTVLAGILKNAEPTMQDVDNVNLNNFRKNGIWISEDSRDRFIEILKECNINNFKVDEDGYLCIVDISNNEYAKELEELTKQKQLLIIDIKGSCYIRDEMTGEIVEYPFKDMDLLQICEKFETTNSKIIEITTNEINPSNILQEILNLK